MPLAYKIFTKDGGKLHSFAAGLPKGISFTYSKTKVNRPKLGKFFVFKTLKAAKNFRGGSMAPIWRVKVEGMSPERGRILMPWDNDTTDFKEYWKEGRLSYYTRFAPAGTYTCNSVTLIEEVDNGKK
jgi:hypothetical protein